jgi:hypothetical protein
MAGHTCPHVKEIRPVTPRSEGCEECLASGDRWVHLRLCLTCGHVGCCDSSKNKHATKHFHATGHPVIKSFEPGEDWGWCYVDQVQLDSVYGERGSGESQRSGQGGNPHTIGMQEGAAVAEMLDCLVSYFSEDSNSEGMPRRYLAYHVVAGPGPSPEGGVASITPLAAYDENEICNTCERVIAVKAGGPAAALEEALVYMDAYHEGDRLRKFQSEVRRSPGRAGAAGR